MHTIYGLCNGHYVPLVSMLLPGMSESIYLRIWNAIRSLYERGNLTHEPTTLKLL